ncbi:manganese catalase family protein [Saccharopolyspora shandongensis]
MFLHVPDEPDPAAANALQEGLGGQFGEMRTMGVAGAR